MLKRAVFGILGLPGFPRGPRDPAPSNIKLRPTDVDTCHKGENCKNELSGLRSNLKEVNLNASGDDDGELNPCEDPKVRRALIRRAAALYAQDKEVFLASMEKHEAPRGEGEDEEAEFDLFAPESEPSDTEETALQQNAKEKKNHRIQIDGDKDDQEEEHEEEAFERGKFHCRLCPNKIFIFEADLEKHLESKVHKRRERHWEKAQQNGAAQASDASAAAKALEEEVRQQRAGRSSRERKRHRGASCPRSQRRRDVHLLSAEDIQRRKEKFQRKKQRRLERKNASSNS